MDVIILIEKPNMLCAPQKYRGQTTCDFKAGVEKTSGSETDLSP